MYKSESEKDVIIGGLMEMFNWLTRDEVRKICEANCWSMECCIDKLVNCDNAESSPEHDNKTIEVAKSENIAPSTSLASILMNTQLPMPPPPPPSFMNLAKEPKKNNADNYPSNFLQVCDDIEKGYQVMVLMRGAPGSGKTYLANKLIELSGLGKDGYTNSNFIFSTDDYFYDLVGNYIYRADQIDTAHSFNHQRTRTKAKQGWSPIIIDNTNLQLWEMKPYVQIAVENGYLLHILEPNTPWKSSSYKLASRNTHNVPKHKIQRMLDKYEFANVDILLKMLKSTQYKVPLPQIRKFPVINFTPSSNMKENTAIIETETLNPIIVKSPPKEQRNRSKTKINSIQTSSAHNEELGEGKIPVYDDQGTKFWFNFGKNSYMVSNQETPQSSRSSSVNLADVPAAALVESTEMETKDNIKNLLDILKENIPNEQKVLPDIEYEKNNSKFIPHNIGCPNENSAFMILRQVYPNQEISSLWDLFVKCDGNIDWAADVLLKEEDAYNPNELTDPLKNPMNFTNICSCLQTNANETNETRENREIRETNQEADSSLATARNATQQQSKSQRSRSGRTPKHQLYKTQDNIETKQKIENIFRFSEEQYPDGVRRFREKLNNFQNNNSNNSIAAMNNYNNSNINHNLTDMKNTLNNNNNSNNSNNNNSNNNNNNNEDENDENDEILELSLGVELVGQLQTMFKNDCYLGEKVNDRLNTNVFIPKSMAKQLFMLWMESAYNQMEEENQKMIREDEYFARLLRNPQYQHYMESPENVHELLDKARLNLNAYEEINEQELLANDASNANNLNQTSLATKLTFLKLCEQFPYIPEDTVFDVFAAYNKDYAQSLKVLQSTFSDLTTKLTIDINARPTSKLPTKDDDISINATRRDETKDKNPDVSTKPSIPRKTLTSEEAKHLALREFEDTRNLAAHHSQLKAECYEKAREAIQKGNGGIAAYYSQIASFHKTKIDMFNHKAANCIMEVHKRTQNNPDLLDLHYLHLIEAICCLDIFLDQHINTIRSVGQVYKHLFVITGRGLHSIGGVSSIKNKVKQRLKERFLRWTEVNPGLLKIKVFSTSQFSADC